MERDGDWERDTGMSVLVPVRLILYIVINNSWFIVSLQSSNNRVYNI